MLVCSHVLTWIEEILIETSNYIGKQYLNYYLRYMLTSVFGG